MNQEKKTLFKDWTHWDTVGLIVVAGIFNPSIGLAILIAVGARELWKVVVRYFVEIRESYREFLRNIGKTRRQLVWTVRNWFTPAPPPLPQPPTQEQKSAAALQRYERTLRMLDRSKLDEIEMTAARAKAKQQYLHDLDQAMTK